VTRGQQQSFDGKSLVCRIVPRMKPAAVRVARARMHELLQAARDEALAEARLDQLDALVTHPGTDRFLGGVMDYAPFLRDLMVTEPARLVRLMTRDPMVERRAILARVRRSWKTDDSARLMKALRRARQDMALLVALADLGGVWDVRAVTDALSAFADVAVTAACRFLLTRAARDGDITLAEPAYPERDSGWIILAMGKFGARELNYSSDIDLIVLFDEQAARPVSEDDVTRVFISLTKDLARLLAEHTEDGYVFRTDLRLRPDPGSTNVAMSTEAALQYYETFGQNWERSAMIKARAVSGDAVAAERYLDNLRPFVWRRYLDFASIADIHSIKRQIHDHRGHGEVAVAGHNIKLGRCGIREIEFFVQTQQLIAGGRHPELRGRRTTDMLRALAQGGWIDARAGRDMAEAYRYLRTVEHCIQMVADEQTHTLPMDEVALTEIGRMVGHASLRAFQGRLRRTLETVRRHYAALFEAAPSLTSRLGNLVFTGDEDDPGTLETLSGLGFSRGSDVIAAIRGWHFGRYPATRSVSARERLTEFVPLLLETLASAENADAAFLAFDQFLSRMPAGVQLFSLLQSNRNLLDLLSLILGTAPRLTETITRSAHVLDALTEPAFFGRLPDRAMLAEGLEETLSQTQLFEDVLDRARVFNQEQSFLIGARVLASTVSVTQAGYAYSDLAEIVVAGVFERVRAAFEKAHGKIRGGRAVVLALGRLGGREMTAASDLDLIMLYDFNDKVSESDGDRPLPGVQYFGRLTQRLVAALSAPTAEGTLYEVDFRLRPSGQSGPLATHIDAFRSYQKRGAWTWEHMALTRARPIVGDARLMRRARKEIDDALLQKRSRKKVAADVVEMRAMVEDAKGGEGAWGIKLAPGGLIDIEFIAQSVQLLNAVKHPDIRATETAVALRNAGEAGLLAPGDLEVLLAAVTLYQALIQILRLCTDGTFAPQDASRGLRERLVRASGLPDFTTLDAHLRHTQTEVRAIFERLLGTPTSQN